MKEYAKVLLPKLTCWRPLFKKELIKCINWAEPEEWLDLRNWCYETFYDEYSNILDEVYKSRAVLKAKTIAVPKISPEFISMKNIYPFQLKIIS